MKRNHKRYIFLCMILSGLFLFSSCAAGSVKINAPVEIRYIVENPLVFSEVVEQDQFGEMAYSGSYFQVSGLKDQQVEAKINEQLKNIYEKYSPGEVPQEISQEVKEKYGELPCVKQEIRLVCYGNFNNVLSFIANYDWEYEGKTKSSGQHGPMYRNRMEFYTEFYNFDLNTGEVFGLKEVFADNVNYGAMIRRQAEDWLKDWEVDVQKSIFDKMIADYLAAPQFLLDGSSLSIRGLTYADPDASDEEEHDLYIDFYLDENFAITERFYDQNHSIYLRDKEGAKTLVTYVGEEVDWEKNDAEAGIKIHLDGFYQKKFPESIKLALKAEETVDAELIGEMKQVLADIPIPEVDAVYDKRVATSRVQDFINVRIVENAHIYAEKTDTSYFNYMHQTLKCYKKDQDSPADIRDIFIEGVDAEKILESLVGDKLEADQLLLEEYGMQRTIDVAAHAKNAAGKIVGFCINSDAIFAEYGGDPALPSYVIELKYADIGEENLNLFR